MPVQTSFEPFLAQELCFWREITVLTSFLTGSETKGSDSLFQIVAAMKFSLDLLAGV